MITKDLIQNTLRPRINALLEPLAKELGFTSIKLSTATYTDDEATFKLVASMRPAGAVAAAKEHALVEAAWLHGIPEDRLKLPFLIGGKPFKLVGYNSRSRTMPFIGEGANKKLYKFRVQSVKSAL